MGKMSTNTNSSCTERSTGWIIIHVVVIMTHLFYILVFPEMCVISILLYREHAIVMFVPFFF